MSDVTPPGMVIFAMLLEARPSNFKPDKPEFRVGLAFTEAALQSEAGKALLKAIDDTGYSNFGNSYTKLAKSATFRSPIRRDVEGKPWPKEYVAFINFKAGADFPPLVIDRDRQPIHDSAIIYPGCIGRCTYRPYAYGGKGTGFSPGISLGLGNFQWLGDRQRLPAARGDGLSSVSCRTIVWMTC